MVYKENPDKTRGDLVVDLDYPRIVGIGYSDWDYEAVAIAKDRLKEAKKNG